MRSKAPLVLMEQIIMVLVFALAAAISLRAFVYADQQSRACAHRDMALSQCRNTAEGLKSCHGDFSRAALLLHGRVEEDGTLLCRYFDGDWNEVEEAEDSAFRLTVRRQDSGHPLLGLGDIIVSDGQHHVLCSLTVSWQEVA